MMAPSLKTRSMAFLLAMVMAVSAMPPTPVFAAMVATDGIVEETARAEETVRRGEILELLSRDEVRSDLRDMGVDADEAAARVQAMSDAELAALDGPINQLAAGQGHNSLVLVLLLVIILVLLI